MVNTGACTGLEGSRNTSRQVKTKDRVDREGMPYFLCAPVRAMIFLDSL